MKIYIATPRVTLPPMFLNLALTEWLEQHPGVTLAAYTRKGCFNDTVLPRFLYSKGIQRSNWAYYFRENPHLTEYTWDLIAMRWEQPDWVVILQGIEEDERLTYTQREAERFDMNVSVLSPHDRFSANLINDLRGIDPVENEKDDGDYDDTALQGVQKTGRSRGYAKGMGDDSLM